MKSSIYKIRGLLTASEKQKFIALIFMQFTVSAIDVIGIASIFPFISLVMDPDSLISVDYLAYLYSITTGIHENNLDNFIITLGVSSAILIMLSTSVRAFFQYRVFTFVEIIRLSISSRLLKAYLLAPYSINFNNSPSDVTKTIISEVDYFIDRIFLALVLACSHLIFALILGAMLLVLHPLLTISALATFSFFYFIIFKFLSPYVDSFGRNLADSTRERHQTIHQSIAMIKSIKAQNYEDFYLQKFWRSAHDSANSMSNYMTASQVPNFFIEGIIFLGLIFTVIIFLLFSGGIESNFVKEFIPIIAIFSFSILRIKPSIQNIFKGISSLKFGNKILNNLQDTMVSFEINRKLSQDLFENLEIEFNKSIKFENIKFAYNQKAEFNFSIKDLTIQKSEKIGIMGKSGSGKSTFLDLLLGLIEPKSGNILIDDQALNSQSSRSWRSKLSYVPQNVSIFNDTLFANITIDSIENDDNLIKASRALELVDLASYQDLLGSKNIKDFINEAKVSGGQRQRIGLARAIYRNPEILILDEVTSALDNKTASNVMNSIYALKDQTVIIVSHNMDTLLGCDRIIHLEEGNISEIIYKDDLQRKIT